MLINKILHNTEINAKKSLKIILIYYLHLFLLYLVLGLGSYYLIILLKYLIQIEKHN